MANKKTNLKPFALKDLLYNKKIVVTLSIVMAFILWLVITTQENPTREETISNVTLTVNIDGTRAAEKGLAVVGDISTQKIKVVVKGPGYVVGPLKAEDIKAYVSADTVYEAGEYKLDVKIERSSTNYEIVSVSPSKIKVKFDYFDKDVTVPLKVELKGNYTVAEGLTADEGMVIGLDGGDFKVSGPREDINKIHSAVAVCNIKGELSKTETFDAEIKLLDKDGKEVSSKNITTNAENIKVKVPIVKRKVVKVEADFTNLPDGFDKNTIKYTINYEEVEIEGAPDVVDKIDKITLQPIDVSTISIISKKYNVAPKLEGVSLTEDIESFLVTIDTSGYIEKNITVTVVTHENLKSGLKSTQTEIKNVRIYGPRAAVNKVTSQNLTAIVDLQDKGEGSYKLPVTFEFTAQKNVWVIGSEYTTTATVKKR